MHVFFAGIGGVAMGPLARVARDLGYDVAGSDKTETRYSRSVAAEGVTVLYGQSGHELVAYHAEHPIDWFVYSSALPETHPELVFMRMEGVRVSKRDEFINHLLEEKDLGMLAVAGTHGKSNTTGMLVWTLQQLGEPVSYVIGTNISFGPNGRYEPGSKYFVYEADEFDRNFLAYRPHASLITSADYDHPDTYPTPEDYQEAFRDFAHRSGSVRVWRGAANYLGLRGGHTHILEDAKQERHLKALKLLGDHTRHNACLVVDLVAELLPNKSEPEIIEALNRYPGTERRLELLKPGLYTDYAHHPVEIRATLQALGELGKPIVAVYQPHQNIRQHHIRYEYGDCFAAAEKVYWLPTYLSREDGERPILTPAQLIKGLDNPKIAAPAELDPQLVKQIDGHLADGKVVVLMSAGDLDDYFRSRINT